MFKRKLFSQVACDNNSKLAAASKTLQMINFILWSGKIISGHIDAKKNFERMERQFWRKSMLPI